VTERFTYSSPLGPILIEASDGRITKAIFPDTEEVETGRFDPALKDAVSLQLDEYFAGVRFNFDLPLDASGTDFQKKVWKQLGTIPYGNQITYLELAMQMGDRNLIRAVGGANARNPVSIIVPCHRVIGSGNKLIGYAGGIWRKKWLLQHEHTHNPCKTTLL
jgi:methylated-DNA-[protein]-cysteine S-methyltransferase